MPKPNRHLLLIANINITYLTDILMGHKQSLWEEDRAADPANVTTYTTIVSATESTHTFLDAPL